VDCIELPLKALMRHSVRGRQRSNGKGKQLIGGSINRAAYARSAASGLPLSLAFDAALVRKSTTISIWRPQPSHDQK
jgi:hypothetical protein